MTPRTPNERVFFCHLQKTGGVSLARMLRDHLGKPAVYPSAADEPGIDSIILTEHLMRHVSARSDEIQVITGHFPLCTTELLDGAFATMTVLREPVERIRSYLCHHRRQTPSDQHLTLAEVYDDDFRFHGLIHNHMVKMLGMTTEEMNAGVVTRLDFNDGHLERAIENLEQIDVVGRLDRYADFVAAIEERFGWNFGGEIEHANITEPEELDDALLERVVNDNALDLALWEHVVSNYPSQPAAGPEEV